MFAYRNFSFKIKCLTIVSKLPRGKNAKCNYFKKQYICESIKETSSLRTHLLQRCPVYKKMKPKKDENQCALARENGVGNAKFVSVGFSKKKLVGRHLER